MGWRNSKVRVGSSSNPNRLYPSRFPLIQTALCKGLMKIVGLCRLISINVGQRSDARDVNRRLVSFRSLKPPLCPQKRFCDYDQTENEEGLFRDELQFLSGKNGVGAGWWRLGCDRGAKPPKEKTTAAKAFSASRRTVLGMEVISIEDK